MSPLLLLVVIEGLSRMINIFKLKEKIKGIKISLTVFISHLIFVDDVILIRKGFKEEWQHFAEIIKILCAIFGMEVSITKSIFICHRVSEEVLRRISAILHAQTLEMIECFKYLGYFLKPNTYMFDVWLWLLKNYGNRICHW